MTVNWNEHKKQFLRIFDKFAIFYKELSHCQGYQLTNIVSTMKSTSTISLFHLPKIYSKI